MLFNILTIIFTNMISSAIYKPFDVDAYFVAQADLHNNRLDKLNDLQEWRMFYLREFPVQSESAMAQFAWSNNFNVYSLPLGTIQKFFTELFPDNEKAAKANLNNLVCSCVALYQLPSGRFTFDRPAQGGIY